MFMLTPFEQIGRGIFLLLKKVTTKMIVTFFCVVLCKSTFIVKKRGGSAYEKYTSMQEISYTVETNILNFTGTLSFQSYTPKSNCFKIY
jgi:hypothetical protein